MVISAQHDDDVSLEKVREDLMNEVVKKIIPSNLLDDKTILHLNPAGKFVVGGPQSDAGLTGILLKMDNAT